MAKTRKSQTNEVPDVDPNDIPLNSSLDDLMASDAVSQSESAGQPVPPDLMSPVDSGPTDNASPAMREAAETYEDAKVADINKWQLAKSAKAQVLEKLAPGKIAESLLGLQQAVSSSVGGITGLCGENVIYGVSVPSLAFEYLTGNTVIPCGSYIEICGVPGVGKSTMGAEIMRWFGLATGLGYLIETENKYNPTHFQNILGDIVKRVQVVRCLSSDEWIRMINTIITKLSEAMAGAKGKPGVGFNIPAALVLDNVASVNTDAELEKFSQAGSLEGQMCMRLAGEIAKFFKFLPTLLADTPFLLVCLNHLKIQKDLRGFPEYNSPGGQALLQYASMAFRMTPEKTALVKTSTCDIKRVKLFCNKNSFGPQDRHLVLRMLTNIMDPGPDGRKTKYDWDWTLIELLGRMEGREKEALSKAGIHLAITKSSDVQNAAWSRSLGMKADDAIPFSELGARLQANKSFVKAFRKALDITPRNYISAAAYAEKLAKEAEGAKRG